VIDKIKKISPDVNNYVGALSDGGSQVAYSRLEEIGDVQWVPPPWRRSGNSSRLLALANDWVLNACNKTIVSKEITPTANTKLDGKTNRKNCFFIAIFVTVQSISYRVKS
jgi:hypothetical protein